MLLFSADAVLRRCRGLNKFIRFQVLEKGGVISPGFPGVLSTISLTTLSVILYCTYTAHSKRKSENTIKDPEAADWRAWCSD